MATLMNIRSSQQQNLKAAVKAAVAAVAAAGQVKEVPVVKRRLRDQQHYQTGLL